MHDDQMKHFEKESLNCSDTEELVNHYLDGDILPGLVPRFHSHILKCEACNQLLQDCEQLLAAAKSLANEPMPTGVRSRLRETLNEKFGETFQVEKQAFTLVKGLRKN